MDITETTAPKSDQQNFDDYVGGPKTVTITAVKAGSAEQPVEIHLTEFPGRPYKPSKSMRRVLVASWGSEASAYVGRRMTLYGDPTVKFGGIEVGGIKISHLSDIDKPLTLALTVKRGSRAPFVVQPLPTEPTKDTSGRDWLTELAATDGDVELIEALGLAARTAGAQPPMLAVIRQAYKDARAELDAENVDTV